jgi:hypothetical protein
MKRTVFLAVMCLVFGICNAQETKPSASESKVNPSDSKETIVFDKTEHDFGAVSESGGTVEYEFTFKNTGVTPLVITKVTPSCGCTTPDYSKEPIAPGKKGFIKVTFNPKGRKNDFITPITVFTDGNPSRISLKIKGEIK